MFRLHAKVGASGQIHIISAHRVKESLRMQQSYCLLSK